MCLAQFTIQGSTDGDRVAQGLRVDDEKGLEYIRGSDSSGGSSIQGSTDGHSNIQGGNDGHSNYQLQGATSGGAERYLQSTTPEQFNIQGPSDGYGQSGYIQGTYDSIPSAPKSLQYNDPSGLRVNWRSYDRTPRPVQQPQAQEQYSAPVSAPQPAPYRQRPQARPQHQPQPQRVSQQPVLPPARSFDNAPSHIKQILQYQQQLPYTNIIPEPYRYDALLAAQAGKQQPQYQNEAQDQYEQEPRRPSYRGKSRQRRQTRQKPPAEPQIRYNNNLPPTIQQVLKFQAQTPYINGIPEQFRFNEEAAVEEQRQQVQAHFQQLAAEAARPRHKRQAQHRQPQPQPQRPPQEVQPQYSTNLPGYIQEVLKFQSQIPYNILPNQIAIRPEKPYVPQPVQPSPQQAQYQGQSNAYQGQADPYQGQQSAYNEAYNNQVYNNQVQQSPLQHSQGQSPYQRAGDAVRPVTENQY
ncbi:adenylate cyclase, terminal-differentiation specific-like [Colletes gigas]|uniref:adenylate cyclase, terminal-differentiation specific-like n=1 Tax=Colletes gigas TaxID=935657 RepID=UPI001C9ABF12|nr:adenylate cyclase, terminal-differentiation specific-like [Colletes gigas]